MWPDFGALSKSKRLVRVPLTYITVTNSDNYYSVSSPISVQCHCKDVSQVFRSINQHESWSYLSGNNLGNVSGNVFCKPPDRVTRRDSISIVWFIKQFIRSSNSRCGQHVCWGDRRLLRPQNLFFYYFGLVLTSGISLVDMPMAFKTCPARKI
jgi:hypothetical protein